MINFDELYGLVIGSIFLICIFVVLCFYIWFANKSEQRKHDKELAKFKENSENFIKLLDELETIECSLFHIENFLEDDSYEKK